MTPKDLVPLVTVTEKAIGSIQDVKGGVLTDIWQTLVGDRVAAWRLKNAAKISEKLDAELTKRGVAINTETIPKRFAFSWFEKATQEDQPEVQELFAKLLANAAQGNDDALERRNIEIVSSLGPNEAILIQNIIAAFGAEIAADEWPPKVLRDGDEFTKILAAEMPPRPFQIALDNLIFLRILVVDHEAKILSSTHGLEDHSDELKLLGKGGRFRYLSNTSYVKITALGISLLDALFVDKPSSSKS